MELQGKIVHFLGDSITEGAGASNLDHCYVTVLGRTYGLKQANNFGISGTRIARQLTPSENPNRDRDYVERGALLPLEADAVVVFGGTNDYGHGDAPMGKFEDRTPNTFYGALHCLYTELIERFPTVPILVVTPTHRLGETQPTAPGKKVLADYVDAILEVARYYSLPVLDLFAVSGMQPAVPIIQETYMKDGLHPSDAGHAKLARLIAEALQAL